MTITSSIDGTKGKFDWTKPVLALFAVCLILLIVLPLSWLAVYSVTDKANHLTLQNFVPLFPDPDFLDPLLTTAIIATTSAAICCAVAAPMGWLVSRTDMPGRQFIRALVTASFVTPPFLGAVAWELLAAPNSGLLNQFYRLVTGAEADEHLFNIYSMTGIIFVISCYTFPFVFVLVANALDNMPGELEDASAILRTGSRRRVAAAAFDHLAAAGEEIHPGPPGLLGGRRQIRRAAPRRDEEVALGRAGVLPGGAAQSCFPAVFRAVQRGILAERDDAGDAVDVDAAQHRVRVHRTVVDPACAQEHGDSGHRDRDHRHHAGAGHRLCHHAPGDRRFARARLSRHRAGRRSRDRARRRLVPQLHPAALRIVRHAVDPADRVPDHQPAVGLSAIAGGVRHHPSRARGCQPHSRRHAAAVPAPDHRAAAAHQRDRDLAFRLYRRDPATFRR